MNCLRHIKKIIKIPLVVENVLKFFRNKSVNQCFEDALEFIAIIFNQIGITHCNFIYDLYITNDNDCIYYILITIITIIYF